MLELKTRKQLASDAMTLARSFNLVRHKSVTYVPADFETRDMSAPPDPERTMWIPLHRYEIQQLAATHFDTLFGSDSELSSFDYMVSQAAQQIRETHPSLLVCTSGGLRELTPAGELIVPSGEFRANTLTPMLNTDPALKQQVLDTVVEWVDSEEDAHSLLAHLATSLSPGWSAVKYVLLLGEGRNGKSLLLKMLSALFGRDNVSNVTRQAIAEQSAVVTELNGKLLNIVYDGRAEYLKDSGTEKSLIAGEPVPIRRLYESTATIVQTNALFLEGLNREPKTNDKSSALQKRLVRFQFPNVYPLDHGFERKMLSEEMLGAFLAVLIDHYVLEENIVAALAPTKKTLELQISQMVSNSYALQFLSFAETTNPLGAVGLLGCTMHELTQQFQSWRLKENDLGTWAEPDVLALFQPVVNTERRSVRINGQPRKVRVVTSFKDEATAYLESQKGDEDEADILDLVED